MNKIFSKNKSILKNFKKNEHISENNNTYRYDIIRNLDKVLVSGYKDINICLFSIDSEMPILFYFLVKLNNELNFITFKEDNYDNIIKRSKMIVSNYFPNSNLIGFKLFNNKLYIFFFSDLRENNENGNWCIMDEICNKKKYMDINICNNVVDLFLHNDEIIFLKGIDNLRIEIPIVSFCTCVDLFELNHMKYSLSKSKKMYDFKSINNNHILRYAIFLSPDDYVFNKKHQYEINYKCRPLTIHY